MMEAIRSLSLKYSDLQTMLQLVAMTLRPLFLDIDSQNKKGIPILFYFVTPLALASYYYTYLISALWFAFWKSQEIGDLIAGVIMLSLAVSSEIAITKLILILSCRNVITKIIDDYREYDTFAMRNNRMAQNVLKNLRVVKKRAMLFWFFIMTNGTIYVLKPLILPGRHLPEDQQIILGLEPSYEYPNYEISVVLVTVSVLFACYVPANITALFIVLSGYIEAQMLALSEELRHLWEDAKQDYEDVFIRAMPRQHYPRFSTRKTQYINRYLKYNLENIARRHATNITLIRKVERVFRSPLFAAFALLTIAVILVLLGGVENTYLQLSYTLMQVTMDCFIGQKLIDASLIFEHAVYDCNWENFDAKNMKIVLLMLQNSQKTIMLSAGGITSLSFGSLKGIMKTIYSIYTTLRSTIKT